MIFKAMEYNFSAHIELEFAVHSPMHLTYNYIILIYKRVVSNAYISCNVMVHFLDVANGNKQHNVYGTFMS